jgi:MSHA biogenesis protein MshG
MYTLLKVGIPIITAITRLVETSRDKALIKALKQVLVTLNEGSQLSVGLARSPKVFSDFFVNLVKVGENTGHLDTIFLYLSDYVQLDVDTKKRMKAAFRYPKMVVFGFLVALIIVNIFVIPAFADMFNNFHGVLPLPTRILVSMSNNLQHYWYVAVGLAGIIMTGFQYYIKTPDGMIRWAKFKLRIPITGWIMQRITLTRFARLYAMVLRAGLTAAKGIVLVGESTDDPNLAQQIKSSSDLIARGNTIASSIEQTRFFPPLMIQMITLGEESGKIDALLDEVAEFYQRELMFDLARMSELIEPILLLIAGFFVLILALGVFLPMWEMASQIK